MHRKLDQLASNLELTVGIFVTFITVGDVKEGTILHLKLANFPNLMELIYWQTCGETKQYLKIMINNNYCRQEWNV